MTVHFVLTPDNIQYAEYVVKECIILDVKKITFQTCMPTIIKSEIEQIADDDELLAYIAEHSSDFEKDKESDTMTTLENVYFGNIDPSEYKQSKDTKKILSEMTKFHDELKLLLTTE